MSLYLLGQHNVVFFGPHDQPRCVRYWAERGLIRYEDARDNGYGVASVRDFLERIRGINDMLGNSRHQVTRSGEFVRSEFDRLMRFVEEASVLCRIAQEQGMPSDATARWDLLRRRKKSIRVPRAISSF